MGMKFKAPTGYPDKNIGLLAQDAPLPPPYERKTVDFSLYSLRCAEIDSAALLLKSKDAFAALAAEHDKIIVSELDTEME